MFKNRLLKSWPLDCNTVVQGFALTPDRGCKQGESGRLTGAAVADYGVRLRVELSVIGRPFYFCVYPSCVKLIATSRLCRNSIMLHQPLTNIRILLGVTGGIAAYKSADLVRRLREAGAEVQVAMTPAASAFVAPLTFQAVSGRSVRTELLDPHAEAGMGHIELARWAHLILIAPATADFLARLAHGMANDLLSTLCLATDQPVAVAPAMNRLMWQNAATQDNCRLLARRGVHIWGPGVGEQACGEIGAGRMLEPLELRNLVVDWLGAKGERAERRAEHATSTLLAAGAA
jgi:phosphopantothenoylcysteine synthetase/decarboxylase